MTDEIKPALTPEEWASASNPADYCRQAYFDCNGDSDEPGTAELPPAIALLNAALPDGSPYKITRADVELIEYGAESCDDKEAYDTLMTLAAKLAALLPTE